MAIGGVRLFTLIWLVSSSKLSVVIKAAAIKVRNSKISTLVHNTLFSCYMYISQNCYQMQ